METKKYFDLIKERKFLAQKELGQNYLINYDACQKIVEALGINPLDKVLEIGCGLGSLSYFILKKPCNAVFIDIDESSLMFDRDNLEFDDNYSFLNQNIMKVDISKYTKIIGNLPYYITSGIIERLLLNASDVKTIIIMIQKEVYQRITSPIKTKDYSPLSILLSYVAECNLLYNVSRHDFVPEPHVDSVVIKLIPKKDCADALNLYKTTKRMFLCRRKTILNNLKSLIHDNELACKILNNAGINCLLRPDAIDLNSYLRLTNELKPYL